MHTKYQPDEASKVLELFLSEDRNSKRLRIIVNRMGLPRRQLTMFINGAAFAEQRKKVADEISANHYRPVF